MKKKNFSTKANKKILVAVDVGNTLMKLGIFHGDTLVEQFQLTTTRERTSDELGLQIKSLVDRASISKPELDGVIISSVVPAINASLDQAFKRHLLIEPAFFNYRWNALKLDVDEPTKVGNDRLADALAGFKLYGGPVLVINFGTASTFNLVSKKGVFVGGAIAPQMEMAANALFQRAAQLYGVSLIPPKSVIGKTTEENIRAGFVLGFIDLVSGLIERYKKELGEPKLKVIATGGGGKLFSESVPAISEYDPYLTLKGLAFAWKKRSDLG